jgi:hypothetical protein
VVYRLSRVRRRVILAAVRETVRRDIDDTHDLELRSPCGRIRPRGDSSFKELASMGEGVIEVYEELSSWIRALDVSERVNERTLCFCEIGSREPYPHQARGH